VRPTTGGAWLCAAMLACATPRPATPDGGDGGSIESSIADVPSDRPSPNPHCGPDGRPAVAYPPGPHEIIDDAVLPDLSFADGRGGTVRLSQFFEPCAARARFLVLRQMAAWSGPSQWHAAHTAQSLRALGDRATVIDLLTLGRDNLPADARELDAWRQRFASGMLADQRVLLDPEYTLRAVYIGVRLLPVVIVVDRRTMRAARILTGPTQHTLDEELARTVARVDGLPPPDHREHPGEHELSEDQWDMLREMARIPPPPPSPTNRYADDPRAAALGDRLFNDTALSTGGVSCASCHQASRDFTDARATGVGVGFARGGRNTPTVRYAPYTRWLFWDGRADSVWSQAVAPIENPIEMRSSRLRVAHEIFDRYRTEYEAVFGALPPLDDRTRFPSDGMPGVAAYDAMPEPDRVAVDRVFANVGKAIEAYERTLRFAPSAADRYAMGDMSALDAEQKAGLHHFFASGCVQCHHGPMLTDDSFHNIAMPSGRADNAGDRGWIDGIAQVLANPFNAAGPFSDAPMDRGHLDRLPRSAPSVTLGMIHTPGLRGTARTGPWGHGGRFTRLDDVMLHYASQVRRNAVTSRVGQEDLHLSDFHMDEQTIRELRSFVEAL